MERMKRLEYKVSFVTPAFLGNAEQSAQWRTPPFKALLRQWWRVVAASCCGYDEKRLREAEGKLFGSANDEGGGSQKSKVRIRLGDWRQSRIGKLPNVGGVCHPEVDHPKLQNCPEGGGKLVDAGQYLGYGPFQKVNAAIQADATDTLRLAWPDGENAIADVLQLMHWFGTLGGRSRNGWGSLSLKHESIASDIPAQDKLIGRVSRPLKECMELSWPHAIGKSSNGRLLIWKSKMEFKDWRDAMVCLAKAKIGFRTQFQLRSQGLFEDRHLLAYPVTNHKVNAWLKDGRDKRRLANQLRFKVAKRSDGGIIALVYHLPCCLPKELAEKLEQKSPSVQQQAAIWEKVHSWLDDPISGFVRLEDK